jgi:hypothetical protein
MRAADDMTRRKTQFQGWDFWLGCSEGFLPLSPMARRLRVIAGKLKPLTPRQKLQNVIVIIVLAFIALSFSIWSWNSPRATLLLFVAVALSMVCGIVWAWKGSPAEQRLARSQRVRFPRAALAGRRSDARIDRFLAIQSTWRRRWLELASAPATANLMPPYDRVTTTARLSIAAFPAFGFSVHQLLGLKDSVWITVGTVVIGMTIVFILAWQPGLRRFRKAIDRIEHNKCHCCAESLANIAPAITGVGSKLGPAQCPSCGVDWPTVVPNPNFYYRELESSRVDRILSTPIEDLWQSAQERRAAKARAQQS